MTTPPSPPRFSTQVPAWEGREAWLATLDRAPWRALAKTSSGRAIRHVVLPVDRGSLGEPTATTILIVGGVHGDEPASGVAVARFHDVVAARAVARQASRDLREATLTLVFVPVLNPDGFAAHTKDNARGVDLNRNFPTRNFGEAPKPGYFPGAAPASEAETRALLELLAGLPPLAAIVAVHQPFACVNYDGPADALAEFVGRAASLPVRADLGYPTPGSMGTYFGVEGEIPTLTLELGAGAPDDEWPRAERAFDAAITFHTAP